jgi:hypothetical protein
MGRLPEEKPAGAMDLPEVVALLRSEFQKLGSA